MSDPEKQQNDIDAVPILAIVQATRTEEADQLWSRAAAYQQAIMADPDFQNASQREVYEAVGRRLEDHLGSDGIAKWLPPDDEEAKRSPSPVDLSPRELEAAMTRAAETGDLDAFIEKALDGL